MTLWAVLATGPSMNAALAEKLRWECRVVAVSDAWRLAPWADVLASADRQWWQHHADAFAFAGRKFCAMPLEGVEHFTALPMRSGTGCNSGLLGMRIAAWLGASRILLLGFDMQGDHFFGRHPAPLNNTRPERFRVFLKQFEEWQGCEVINCTPGSALTRFPFMELDDAVRQWHGSGDGNTRGDGNAG